MRLHLTLLVLVGVLVMVVLVVILVMVLVVMQRRVEGGRNRIARGGSVVRGQAHGRRARARCARAGRRRRSGRGVAAGQLLVDRVAVRGAEMAGRGRVGCGCRRGGRVHVVVGVQRVVVGVRVVGVVVARGHDRLE